MANDPVRAKNRDLVVKGVTIVDEIPSGDGRLWVWRKSWGPPSRLRPSQCCQIQVHSARAQQSEKQKGLQSG